MFILQLFVAAPLYENGNHPLCGRVVHNPCFPKQQRCPRKVTQGSIGGNVDLRDGSNVQRPSLQGTVTYTADGRFHFITTRTDVPKYASSRLDSRINPLTNRHAYSRKD